MAVAVSQPLYYNEKHKENLLQDLNKERFETDSFCDATLQVDDKTFSIHKCIVGKISVFFRKLFKVDMKEKYAAFANMKGLNSETMESVLNYIYTGSVEINEDNVFDLLAAAEYLLIDGLTLCCRNYIISNANVDNCIRYYVMGKARKMLFLERKVTQIMNDNYKQIIEKADFLSLDNEEAMHFLSKREQDNSAFKAKDVYDGIMAWVRYDIEHRKAFLAEMLKLVKFQCLPKRFLMDLKKEDLIEGIGSVNDTLNEEIKWKTTLFQTEVNNCPSRNTFVVVVTNHVQLFDVFTKTWTKLPDLPNDATKSCIVCYHDYLYVIGGSMDKRLIQRLNFSDENALWENAGQTLVDRCEAAAVVMNDSIFISGGNSKSVEVYKTMGAERQRLLREEMNNSRLGHAMVKHQDHIYCFTYYGPMERYSTGHLWQVVNTTKSSYPCVAVAGCNQIYFIARDSRLELYNPVFNVWRTLCQGPLQYRSYSASYMDEKIYTFGRLEPLKKSSYYLDEKESESKNQYGLAEYDVTLNTWRQISEYDCDSEDCVVVSI